jgi:glycosyltransferase involved in cell wall biosynthesis
MEKASKQNFQVSLVVPVKNEAGSLATLVNSINRQTFPPAEIILVDGGSTDGTPHLAVTLTAHDARYRVIRATDATPGRGRNIGVENARHDWIAFTDAGIKLSDDWLEKLVETAAMAAAAATTGRGDGNGSVSLLRANDNGRPISAPSIVYGDYAPLTGTRFEKCAALAYVQPRAAAAGGAIRGRFIASSLMRRDVWRAVGGFPDLRAAEDLMFMEAAENQGFRAAFAPQALVYWQLRPDVTSTFRKFVAYSKTNVSAGRQYDWHHAIAKQYFLLALFFVPAIFHSSWWLLVFPLWFFGRAAKRILAHRREFGLRPLFDPTIFFGVAFITLVIDLATFTGWAQAILQKKR